MNLGTLIVVTQDRDQSEPKQKSYTEMLYAVIPIGSRDAIAQMAEKIMPGSNEGEMFDDLRYSVDGKAPATHLATECPCTFSQAKKWTQVFLPLAKTPTFYPKDVKIDRSDINRFQAMREDATCVAFFTDWHNGRKIKTVRTVRVGTERMKMKTLTGITDITDALGLVQIPSKRRWRDTGKVISDGR